MSAIQTYLFDTPANFNQTQTSIAAALAKLALTAETGLVHTAALGSVSVDAETEFSGGTIRQIDRLPTGAVVAATYTSSKDLSYDSASGSLTSTDVGSPALIGGKLRCLGGGNNAVFYDNASLTGITSQGALKVKYTPNYSGTPSANIQILQLKDPASATINLLTVFHSASGGSLRITGNDSVGTSIWSAVVFAAWSPVAGTEYEIELNFDLVAGAHRIFVNGAQVGGTLTQTATRTGTATRLYVGAGTTYTAANAEFNDVVLYSTVQHTAGYAAGYTLNETRYLAGSATGFGFTYTRVGSLQAYTAFASTVANAPHFTIDGKYWNGSAWVASNGTYAQSNTAADITANIASLVPDDALTPIVAYFQAQNVQGSISALTLTHTGQQYQASGYLEPVSAGAISAESITSLAAATVTTPAGTSIKYGLKIDGVLKYWNGSSWVTSNGAEAQLNTLADVNTNLGSLLLSTNSTVILRAAFFTTDTQQTPSVGSLTIEYDFGGVLVLPETCLVTGYYLGANGSGVSGATVTFSLVRESKQYAEASNAIIEKSVAVTTDANGYFETELIRSSEFEVATQYQMVITKESDSLETSETAPGVAITFSVPDAVVKDVTDLITHVAA